MLNRNGIVVKIDNKKYTCKIARIDIEIIPMTANNKKGYINIQSLKAVEVFFNGYMIYVTVDNIVDNKRNISYLTAYIKRHHNLNLNIETNVYKLKEVC